MYNITSQQEDPPVTSHFNAAMFNALFAMMMRSDPPGAAGA
jgi:hypothetical protein